MPPKLKRNSCAEYPMARKVRVVGDLLQVHLRDGRAFELPLKLFPSVNLAPEPARSQVRVIAPGIGIKWPFIGYELGVGGLLHQHMLRARRAS